MQIKVKCVQGRWVVRLRRFEYLIIDGRWWWKTKEEAEKALEKYLTLEV